jgi:hypothetical protein
LKNCRSKSAHPGRITSRQNLVIPANQQGISIDANNVSLDLSGFLISGTDGSLNAIAVASGQTDITIRNGSITLADAGIAAASATHLRVDSIHVSRCNAGINVGTDSIVSNSTASENGSSGIVVGLNSTVANCQASANSANGIEAGQKCTVRDSSAARNDFSGVSVGDYSKVIGVTSTDNSGFGINGSVGVHIVDCTATRTRATGSAQGISPRSRAQTRVGMPRTGLTSSMVRHSLIVPFLEMLSSGSLPGNKRSMSPVAKPIRTVRRNSRSTKSSTWFAIVPCKGTANARHLRHRPSAS